MIAPEYVRLVFPNQLFEAHFKADSGTLFLVIEDDLFFRQYPFHNQKLVLHRASMQAFRDELTNRGFSVHYLETSANTTSMDGLSALLSAYPQAELSFYELTDDWLTQRLRTLLLRLDRKAQRLDSPGFLTNLQQIEEYFRSGAKRMQNFYEWQRKRLGVLLESDGSPVGGRWSFDADNRKRLPKNICLPPAYPMSDSPYVSAAQTWVREHFPANPGALEPFDYPINHAGAIQWLNAFVAQRLALFGPYEDAISSQEPQVFHSILSPLLNIGLLTPHQVLDAVLNHATTSSIPIESLEGFIRQLIGWREYMRATYLRFGRSMRRSNYLEFSAKLNKSWWDASVGLEPIDTVIASVLKTGYAHHIERLMILGNMMLLLRIHPDEVYEWFMSLFIDAYDWVMVPNVYAMSQFAAGELITTKPYISGSNYILKMSDYKKGAWSEIWDALYWTFIHDHRQIIEKNYRSRMMVTLYDKFEPEKKLRLDELAQDWIPRPNTP